MHSDRDEFRDDQEMELEGDLRQALRRVDAPPGLAERVLARVATEGVREAQTPAFAPPQRRAIAYWPVSSPAQWRGAIAAVLVLTVLFSSIAYQRARQTRSKRTAQAAAQQFTLAMRITQATLQSAGRHIKLGPSEGQS